MAHSPDAPRVLLVMPEQWPRALLRAALREAGYDAAGTRTLVGALRLAEPETGRGPVGLIVIDQEFAIPAERRDLDRLRRLTGAPLLLVTAAGREIGEEPWLEVIRRPVSIGELVEAVERAIPLPPGARHPID